MTVAAGGRAVKGQGGESSIWPEALTADFMGGIIAREVEREARLRVGRVVMTESMPDLQRGQTGFESAFWGGAEWRGLRWFQPYDLFTNQGRVWMGSDDVMR